MMLSGHPPPPHVPAADPLNVLTLDEHRAVNALIKYRKHPALHPVGLPIVHKRIIALRKAVWLAAERGILPNGGKTRPGWNVSNRDKRYHLLWQYSRG